jgi:hypothetical protein
MYSTCLFCHSDLGRNEAVGHFPIGRRLAFDAAKGRVWVVCRGCERWNLTPLEERWEAIEECESAFRATKLRVSTDHIGLARLKEGLELVRIGEPQRPEMAAWRYGDQFGRRRRKHMLFVAGAAVVAGTTIVAGPALGLASGVSLSPIWHVLRASRAIYRMQREVTVPREVSAPIRLRLTDVPKTQLYRVGDEIRIRVRSADPAVAPWWRFANRRQEVDVGGEEALRVAGFLLPRLNQGGGSVKQVRQAVEYLEQRGPVQLFQRAAFPVEHDSVATLLRQGNIGLLSHLSTANRLALEMAAHEDSERRALEGELHLLEAAWKDAEEIAGIADDMFLPASMDEDLARLKRRRDGG